MATKAQKRATAGRVHKCAKAIKREHPRLDWEQAHGIAKGAEQRKARKKKR